MLLSFCPNPCIERVLTLDGFAIGQTHRADSNNVCEIVGGKALNAARVARECGLQVLATGWFGADRSDWFASQMQARDIGFEAVETSQTTRVATLILDSNGKVPQTEVVENGHALDIQDGTRMLATMERLLPDARMLLIGGSYPPSDTTFDAHASVICGMARRFEVPVFYDGKGAAWEIAIRSGAPPWAIKPNLDEASAFWKREVSGEGEERRAIAGWLKLGIEVVLLSCGARGAWIGTQAETIFLQAPEIETVSSVGSGDCLVGAFICKYLQSAHLAPSERIYEAARWGVAAGSANAAQSLSAHITRDEIEALLGQVRAKQHLLSLTVR